MGILWTYFLLMTDQVYHLIHRSHPDILGNYRSFLLIFVLFSENKNDYFNFWGFYFPCSISSFCFFLEMSTVLTKIEFRLNILSFLLLLPVYAPFILCTSSIPFREAGLCPIGLSLAMVTCPPSVMTTFLLWMKLMIIRDFGLCFICRKYSATRLMIVYRFFFLP